MSWLTDRVKKAVGDYEVPIYSNWEVRVAMDLAEDPAVIKTLFKEYDLLSSIDEERFVYELAQAVYWGGDHGIDFRINDNHAQYKLGQLISGKVRDVLVDIIKEVK